MSNVAIRRNGDKPAPVTAPSSEATWDPWRTMRSLLAWDPFREMAPLDERQMGFAPAFDVRETQDAYLFHADLPGIADSDLEVSVTGNRLTVAGKRHTEKEEKGERYYTFERSYGSFSRSFTLPEGADMEKLAAALDKGVLTITVPKRPEIQARKIAVKSEAKPGAPKS